MSSPAWPCVGRSCAPAWLPALLRVVPSSDEIRNGAGCGVEAAKDLACERRGKQFDPMLSDLMADEADVILSGLDTVATWDAVIEAEPALAVVLSGDRFDAALLAIASFVDLKSPYFLGHARAVGDLAAAAGARLGLRGAQVRGLRRAGLVHDLGRLVVSNVIWDKRDPLGAGEWERVRLQPYLTERMLEQRPPLAPLAAIAVQHRERLDGSGYPRGLSGSEHIYSKIDAGNRAAAGLFAMQHGLLPEEEFPIAGAR
jgi:hypothetical protein